MCHGFARNYGDLVGLRILLGIAEAGMIALRIAYQLLYDEVLGIFPGVIFYLSWWVSPRSKIAGSKLMAM